MLVRLVLAIVLVAATAFAAPKEKAKPPPKPTPEGPCEKKQMEELHAALRTAERSTWPGLVSKAIARACEAKLPAPVASALEDMHSTAVEEHAATIVQAFRDAPEFPKAGCEKWEDIANAHMAPGDRMHMLYKDCALAKAALFTETELVDEVPDFGLAFVAAPLNKWLTTNGMEAPVARKLTRALLALDEAKKPEPKDPKKADPKKPEPKKKKK